MAKPSGLPAAHHNFTLKANGILNAITTPLYVGITPASPGNPLTLHETTALWDTGATNSCITAEVAKAIGAVPTGRTMVHGAHGAAQTNTYLVDFVLPNKVRITDIKVTEVVSTVGGFGAIVGMDVINTGDFVISNTNGKTVVSFQVPSRIELDFGDPNCPINHTLPTKRTVGTNYTPPKKKRKK